MKMTAGTILMTAMLMIMNMNMMIIIIWLESQSFKMMKMVKNLRSQLINSQKIKEKEKEKEVKVILMTKTKTKTMTVREYVLTITGVSLKINNQSLKN